MRGVNIGTHHALFGSASSKAAYWLIEKLLHKIQPDIAQAELAKIKATKEMALLIMIPDNQ